MAESNSIPKAIPTVTSTPTPPLAVEEPKQARVPTPDETMEIVQAHPLVLQFKNSLKWVQGGTGVSIERMSSALDSLAMDVYLAGMQHGLDISKELVKHEVKKG